MLYSASFIRTRRDDPSDASCASASLMARSGLVRRVANGLYAYLPLGLRALRKLEAIVRQEMEKAGALEMKPPVMTPGALWRESGRWDAMGDTMLRAKNRLGDDLVVSPTAEELFTAIARGELASYKDLPLALFQINTKYRDELRPRYGLMRTREFTMMDAYSFDLGAEGLDRSYRSIAEAFRRVFRRCGVATIEVRADSGEMGGSQSEEFMVESDIGDDRLLVCPSCGYAANSEAVAEAPAAEASAVGAAACPSCSSALRDRKGNELGHVFKLGDKYCRSMRLSVLDEQGRQAIPVMGCYGIGMDRTLASIVEGSRDERGIVWPASVAPFAVEIVPLRTDGPLMEAAIALQGELESRGLDVLLDDRDERAGVKFADADLVGSPLRIVLGKLFESGEVELKLRREATTASVPYAQAAQRAALMLGS